MITRRTLLKSSMATGAVTVFTGLLPTSVISAQSLRIRRSLHGMDLDHPDLATYRDFVGMMQQKDQNKLVSWLGFSLQHGKMHGDYKYCPHGDWYFLPWHRAFLTMYENAAIELTGNSSFAMPYWDWAEDRTLPRAFSDSTYKGVTNPLFVPNRNYINLPDSLVGPKVMNDIYDSTVFEVFGTSRNPAQDNLDPGWVIKGGGHQGTLEATPHNNIHNDIGVYMPFAGSPRDPIFMMHHSNIDRIWASWNSRGRKNSTDPLWLDMPFKDNFIAADGSLYSATVKELQNTSKFGYTYDKLPPADNKKPNPKRDKNMLSLFGASATVRKGMQRVRVENLTAAKTTQHLDTLFTLKSSTLNSVTAIRTPEIAPKQLPEIFALIKDIEVGEDVKGVRVFVNREDVSVGLPDTDPHFVATIAFLSHQGTHHKMLPSAIVELTETLRNLARMNKIEGDEISVQLIPLPRKGVPIESVGTVFPASIEIAVL